MRSKAIDVRNRRRELDLLSRRDTVAQFAAVTRDDLASIAAPLMHWRNIRGEDDAYRFELLVTWLEEAALDANKARVDHLRARVEAEVALLMKNQNPVKAKAAAIKQVESSAFWSKVAPLELEKLRRELRGIMRFKQHAPTGHLLPKEYDVREAVTTFERTPKLEGLALVEYNIASSVCFASTC